MANKAADAGLNVIVAALTANENARNYVSENVRNLIVGSIECPITLCAERDPKGLYAKAKRGEIDTLIGYNTEYTPPENPDIVLDTGQKTPEALAEIVEQYLYRHGWMSGQGRKETP